MIRETGMQQQYCLRWNNHKTNLLTVFGELFRNEDFTDVTLVCEGGSIIKCHKMVLAASSSYFQGLFSELQCKNPIVVLKDVRYSEIQAILEYMYKGEVSITVEEVEPLLKVAEALKVKGLVGENNIRECSSGEEYNTISTSSTFGISSNRSSSQTRQTSSPNDLSKNAINIPLMRESTSNESANNTSAGSRNENNENSSPPHSTGIHPPFQKNPYLYGKSGNRMGMPIWPMSGLPISTPPTPHTAAVMLNTCYEAAIAASNADMPPLRRKKIPNFNMNRDTPILRTVLGQGQADSSQPMSLVCHNDGQEQPQSNGPITPQDGSYGRIKSETHSEDAHSLCMEGSFMDEDISQDRGNKMMHSSSSSPQSFYSDSKGGVTSGIASYVPSQKPEWKRYKQYTRNDIMSAIDAVRNGMSALQAARKYGVPSRTLYDKVKKLGITTSRPFRRSNGSNGAAFPYGITGASGAMMFGIPNEDEQGQGSVMDHGFLQHALESGGKVKFENSEREALSATPPAGPPHSLLLQRALEVDEQMKSEMVGDREALSLTQGDNSGTSSASPPPHDRSPSPNLIKYAQHSRSLTPSPTLRQTSDDYEDQVEDLSMTRKPDQQQPQQQQQQQQQQSRVIMPPMNQAQATMLATCSDSARD